MLQTEPWQSSLFAVADGPLAEAPGGDVGFLGLVRHQLAHGAWLDHQPAWLSGADGLFDVVVDELAWQQGTERIQGEDVLRPRLTASLPIGELTGRLATFGAAGEMLGERYGVAFERVGVNLYRDGRDSVAWHGDRIARDLPSSIIAIVSLGQARPFKAKPVEGGSSLTFKLGHGDLLVMGGSFQRTWRHAVPKVAAAGPRISVTYRHAYPGHPG